MWTPSMSWSGGSVSTGSPVIKICGKRGAHRRRDAVSGNGRTSRGVRRDGQGARARIVATGGVESARFHDRQPQDSRRSPVRRRSRNGDAGRAFVEGDRGGTGGAGSGGGGGAARGAPLAPPGAAAGPGRAGAWALGSSRGRCGGGGRRA